VSDKFRIFAMRYLTSFPPDFAFSRGSGEFLFLPTKIQNIYYFDSQSVTFLNLFRDYSYLLPELIEEMKEKVSSLPESITGVTFRRRHIFLDKWMKRGTYPVMILRMFRYGKAVCEQRLMDEHIELLEGESMTFENDFVDHNLNNLSWWAQKHVGYAVREAAELLDVEYNLTGMDSGARHLSPATLKKRNLKLKYAKQPLFWRSFAYFCYRYFFKMAFLEGKEGFLWTFMQGWWYRTLVDAKIFEIKKACGNDSEKIKQHLKAEYHIEL
jgi:hypothetical protein